MFSPKKAGTEGKESPSSPTENKPRDKTPCLQNSALPRNPVGCSLLCVICLWCTSHSCNFKPKKLSCCTRVSSLPAVYPFLIVSLVGQNLSPGQ